MNNQTQNSIQIDLSKTEAIICRCGNEAFERYYFLRSLPALLSPTLRKELIPIEAFRCIKCKKVLEFDQKKPG